MGELFANVVPQVYSLLREAGLTSTAKRLCKETGRTDLPPSYSAGDGAAIALWLKKRARKEKKRHRESTEAEAKKKVKVEVETEAEMKKPKVWLPQGAITFVRSSERTAKETCAVDKQETSHKRSGHKKKNSHHQDEAGDSTVDSVRSAEGVQLKGTLLSSLKGKEKRNSLKGKEKHSSLKRKEENSLRNQSSNNNNNNTSPQETEASAAPQYEPSGPSSTNDTRSAADQSSPTNAGSGHNRQGTHFRRVDEEKYSPSSYGDNSYWSKGGDSFAEQAAGDLIKVRGRDFRHEKSKKKRASWKGSGAIDLRVNSVKLNCDSD